MGKPLLGKTSLCSSPVANLCSSIREKMCKNGMKLPKQEFLCVDSIISFFLDSNPWAGKNFGKRECIVILTSLN